MHAKPALADIATRLGVNTLFIAFLLMSLAVNVLLSLHAVTTKTTIRETFIPPTATQQYWVEEDNVSPEYVRATALFALDRLMSVTADTALMSGEQILPWAHPSALGGIDAQIRATAAKLKDTNAATTWIPQEWVNFDTQHAVAIRGLVTTYIGDRVVSRASRAFWVKLDRSGGRWCLAEIREVVPTKLEGADTDAKRQADAQAQARKNAMPYLPASQQGAIPAAAADEK